MEDQLRELRVDHEGVAYRFFVRLRPNSESLIVFLHGWGGSKDNFAEAFSSDSLKEYGICTIDLLGFGDSEKPEDFSYDLLDQAKIVAQAINSLNARKVYLVGHSMGGGIGLLAAPRVKNLAIFINAESNLAPNGSGIDSRLAAKQPFWLFKSFTLPFIKFLLGVHPRHGIRVWAKSFGEASPLAMHKSVQSLATWSDSSKLLPLFNALPHKAYIYSEHGKRKKDVVPKLSEAITYESPDSGHALMTDNPTDFYRIVTEIIRAN
jgi:pimeloyl-ACP methyl ester carboxylesterase